MTTHPKEWVYRFYMAEKINAPTSFEFFKKDVLDIFQDDEILRITLKNGSRYTINMKYMIYWRLVEEEQRPVIQHKGPMGAY